MPTEVKTMSFGDNLKKAREEKALSRKQMSDLLRITPPAYANYENDVREPNFKTILQICAILDISTDKLFESEKYIENMPDFIMYGTYYMQTATKYTSFMTGSPIDAVHLDEYLYFMSDENEYDYIAFSPEDFWKLSRNEWFLHNNVTLGKDAKTETFASFCKDFANFTGKYDEWLNHAEEMSDKNKVVFPKVYEDNLIPAQKYLKDLGYDDEHLAAVPGEYCDRYLKMCLDLRKLRTELHEKYDSDMIEYTKQEGEPEDFDDLILDPDFVPMGPGDEDL